MISNGLRCGLCLLIATALLSAVPATARAASADELATQQSKAEALEHEQRWLAAADVYAELARRQPTRPEWTRRLRLCQRQDAIARRYSDPSLLHRLQQLSLDQTIDLLGEVLGKIETHFVEDKSLRQLLNQAMDDLDHALRNRTFARVALPNLSTEDSLRRCRQQLRERWTDAAVAHRGDAQQRVRTLVVGLQQAFGVRPQVLVVQMVHAICEALDDYSAYLGPERFLIEQGLAQHDIAGVGIDVQLVQEQMTIVAVLPDSPAAHAGIVANEMLIRIDGKSAREFSLEDASLRLLGKEGSTVTLEVQGVLDKESRTVEIRRQRLNVSSIAAARIVDGLRGIGYIQLAFFQKNTVEELDGAVSRLSAEGMRALILDLRGNPGGFFHAAVQVADRLVSEGVLASTRGRSGGASQVYRTQDMQKLTLPLVVLIDGETASAAEVLAGALKDHHRGVLVGQKSFGKGSMQHVFPLRTIAAGLRLTTAKIYSPLDYPYSDGVVPDVMVDRHTPMSDMDPTFSSMHLPQHQFDIALRVARELLAKP